MKNWRKLYDGRPRLYVDNFVANAGSGGDTFAADDIAGVKHPRSKISLGADGSATDAIGGAGAVSAAVIRTTLASDDPAVALLTTIDGDTGAAVTALQLIDDTVFVDDAAFTAATSKVIATGGIVTADSVDSGDIGAFAMLANRQQKITLYDSSGVELAVGGGTQYTEDAAAAANPVGNAIMLVREDGRAGSLTTADGDNVALRGNNKGEAYVIDTDANALLTTIDGDTGNIVTAVQIMDDWDESDRAKVNIIVGQAGIAAGAGAVGVTVPRVTLASDDPAVALLGTIDADTGAILTAVQLIDDTIFAEDVAAQAADKGIAVLAVRRDADTSLVGTDNDYANLQVDANGYLKVEIFDGGGSHTVDNAGTFAVQVDGSALTALQLIDNTIIVDDAAFTPATTSVNMAGFQADEGSTDSVDEGDAGAARMTLDRKVIVTPQPHTGGGLTTARSLDLDESEEEIKASAGQVYGWNITNFRTTTVYVKFYNATAANVTVGTTTPLFTLAIPGNASDDTMLSMMGTHGIVFDTAICWAATTGLADNDTGAPSANDVAGTVWYK